MVGAMDTAVFPYTTLFRSYPAEIEGFLLEHPAVAQAAVIGVPDERLGQVGKAFIVVQGGKNAGVSADELIAWRDRKSTRLNSSHPSISYAVFCLTKKRTVH